MFNKPMRIENPELLKEVRSKKCTVCGLGNTIDAHHIKSRGAGGDDVPENLLPLCRRHHNEIHQIGMSEMRRKYLILHYALKSEPYNLK